MYSWPGISNHGVNKRFSGAIRTAQTFLYQWRKNWVALILAWPYRASRSHRCSAQCWSSSNTEPGCRDMRCLYLQARCCCYAVMSQLTYSSTSQVSWRFRLGELKVCNALLQAPLTDHCLPGHFRNQLVKDLFTIPLTC